MTTGLVWSNGAAALALVALGACGGVVNVGNEVGEQPSGGATSAGGAVTDGNPSWAFPGATTAGGTSGVTLPPAGGAPSATGGMSGSAPQSYGGAPITLGFGGLPGLGGAGGQLGSGGLPGSGGAGGGGIPDERRCGTTGTLDNRSGSRVYTIAYSPDGSLVAYGADYSQNNIKLFRTSDNELVRELAGHPGTTYSVAFSPNGKLLASGGMPQDGKKQPSAFVWNAQSGAVVARVASTGFSTLGVEFSHNGKLLATASQYDGIELWSTTDYHRVRLLPLSQESTYVARFSPDDKLLATSGTKNVARIWRVADGKLLTTLSGHTYSVSDARFSPDGKQIVTAGYDNTARIWDATSGQQLQVLEQSDKNAYLAAAIWYDANRLITNDWNGGLRSWVRSADGTFVFSCELFLEGQSLGLAVSPDRRELRAGADVSRQRGGVWIFR